MEELTQKQQKIFDYLKMEIQQKGYPPAIREICSALGLRSTSTVHAHLSALENKGYIRRSATKNRSIEILEQSFYIQHSVIQAPIVKQVKGGKAFLEKENIEDYFPVSANIAGAQTVFLLRILDNSMVHAGILTGDLVLVSQQDHAANGDKVVVILDSVTVRTYYKERNQIRLQPENPAFKPITTTKVIIYGKVIGLYRLF